MIIEQDKTTELIVHIRQLRFDFAVLLAFRCSDSHPSRSSSTS